MEPAASRFKDGGHTQRNDLPCPALRHAGEWALSLGGIALSKELVRAAQYRKLALETLTLAENHLDHRQGAVLLELARTYHRLAEQLEEVDRLDAKRKLESDDAAVIPSVDATPGDAALRQQD